MAFQFQGFYTPEAGLAMRDSRRFGVASIESDAAHTCCCHGIDGCRNRYGHHAWLTRAFLKDRSCVQRFPTLADPSRRHRGCLAHSRHGHRHRCFDHETKVTAASRRFPLSLPLTGCRYETRAEFSARPTSVT